MSIRTRSTAEVLAVACFFFSSGAFADIYKTVDDQGRVHYSNQPSEGAESMELESRVQVVKPDARQKTQTEQIERARAKRRQIRQWADREASRVETRKKVAEQAKRMTDRAAERKRKREQTVVDMKREKRKIRSERNRKRRHKRIMDELSRARH